MIPLLSWLKPQSKLQPHMQLATLEQPSHALTGWTLLAAVGGAAWHWLHETRTIERAVEAGFHQVALQAKTATVGLELGIDLWRALRYLTLVLGGPILEEAWRGVQHCRRRRA